MLYLLGFIYTRFYAFATLINLHNIKNMYCVTDKETDYKKGKEINGRLVASMYLLL